MDAVAETGDEKSAGRLWDMAAARLSKTDISVMRKHADFLKRNKGLQEIAEQLGRMAGQVYDPLSSTPLKSRKWWKNGLIRQLMI